MPSSCSVLPLFLASKGRRNIPHNSKIQNRKIKNLDLFFFKKISRENFFQVLNCRGFGISAWLLVLGYVEWFGIWGFRFAYVFLGWEFWGQGICCSWVLDFRILGVGVWRLSSDDLRFGLW